jgi:CheY-like chemotaxis protein
VQADRTRLKQVLLNLLSNAVKYNRHGGSVSLGCEPSPAATSPAGAGAGHHGPAGRLRIRIHDTGAGLTAEQAGRLFVPFERLDAEARHIQGTGIGLALSKRLVELMGGRVGVDSTPGTGSTFWVELPLADAPAEPGESTDSPDDRARVDAAPTAMRRTVLCVEDNPANLRLIEAVFAQRPGIRLLTAMAPGLGLELARTHRPALILLDINLPDMDGYAVMECLREHGATRDIPVVAVSANAMPRDLERARAAGFAAYLTKPLDIDRLLQLLDETLAASAGAGPGTGPGA